MDDLVAQGAIVEAVKLFFDEESTTSDYGDVLTGNKAQMIEKMEGFVSAIAKVNGITHHGTIVEGNVSASEFTFDFDMKDDSRILWHEIIKREWNDAGFVSKEEYFKAG